jgi:hypothetical protein
MLDVLRNEVIKDFSKMWEVNDKAHRVDHFTRVEKCGELLNEKLNLGYDPELIMLVAHFHDMFAWSRHNHHLLSAEWVRTTDYPIIAELDTVDRELVAMGCEHHRASYKGKFFCRFDELMNSADRELPGDVDLMIERAVLYRMNRGMSRADAMKPAIDHIKEKFGAASGYARYPKMYLDVFGDELTEQRRLIDNL